jgi:hypothetical protein
MRGHAESRSSDRNRVLGHRTHSSYSQWRSALSSAGVIRVFAQGDALRAAPRPGRIDVGLACDNNE